MTGADQGLPLPPEPYFSAPALRPETPAWSEASARPAEDIREFIQWCLSETEQAGGSTELEPWQERWVRQAWESGFTDSPGARLTTRARGYGKTSAMASLTTREKEFRGPSTQFMIEDELQETPMRLSTYEQLRRQDQLWQALQVVVWPAMRFVDTHWDDVFPRRSQPLLELALQSQACLSRTLSPAEGGTRSHQPG